VPHRDTLWPPPKHQSKISTPKGATLAAKLKNKMANAAKSNPLQRQNDLSSWLKTKIDYTSESEYSTTSLQDARDNQRDMELDKTITATAPSTHAKELKRQKSLASKPNTHPNGTQSDSEIPNLSRNLRSDTKQTATNPAARTTPNSHAEDATIKDNVTLKNNNVLDNKPQVPVQDAHQASAQKTVNAQSQNVDTTENKGQTTDIKTTSNPI
jgi:hypothetical protein